MRSPGLHFAPMTQTWTQNVKYVQKVHLQLVMKCRSNVQLLLSDSVAHAALNVDDDGKANRGGGAIAYGVWGYVVTRFTFVSR